MPTFPPDPTRDALREQDRHAADSGLGQSSAQRQAIFGMIAVVDSEARTEFKLTPEEIEKKRAAYWSAMWPVTAAPMRPVASAADVALARQARAWALTLSDSWPKQKEAKRFILALCDAVAGE